MRLKSCDPPLVHAAYAALGALTAWTILLTPWQARAQEATPKTAPEAQTSGRIATLSVGVSALPVNLRDSAQTFRLDGARQGGQAPLQTTSSTSARWVEPALAVALDLQPWRALTLAGRLHALTGSFASNEGKNGRVYGAQVGLGVGWAYALGPVTLTPRLEGGWRIGGYGVTSFDRGGEPTVTVGSVTFADDDIGVHVIEDAWQLGAVMQLEHRPHPRWRVSLELGWMWTLSRSAQLNIAGERAGDGQVEWVRRSLDDPSLEWTVDGARVNRAQDLPYDPGGPQALLMVGYIF